MKVYIVTEDDRTLAVIATREGAIEYATYRAENHAGHRHVYAVTEWEVRVA